MSKIVNLFIQALDMKAQGCSNDEIRKVLYGLDFCRVRVWREDASIPLPRYAKTGDACMDVYVYKVEKKDDGRIIYHTGLHFRLPEDYEMEIRPRSSISKTLEYFCNTPGTLDSGFTGELTIVHRNILCPNEPPEETWYDVGDRVAQILIRRRELVTWDMVLNKEDLGETERGEGSYGSSGR